MPSKTPRIRHSIALRLALMLLAACVLCVLIAGALLARSEADRLRSEARDTIRRNSIELAEMLDQDVSVAKTLALSANEMIAERAFRTPARASALPPLADDGSRRQHDGISAAFIAKDHPTDKAIADLFAQTETIWRVLTPTLSDSLFNFYLITEEQFIRIFPPQWALEIEAEHNFKEDVFYSVATPEKNPARTPVWTPMYYDDVWQKWMTSLIVPVYVNEEFRGITGNDFILDDLFSRLMQFVRLHDYVNVLLLNDKGELVADSERLHAILEKRAKMNTLLEFGESSLLPATAINELLLATPLELVQDIKGRPHFVSAQRLDSLGWHVVLVGDETFVNERIIALQTQLLLSTLVVGVALAAIIFLILSRTVLRPLRQLVNASTEIASGQWDTPLPEEGKNEIGQLNHSFADMVNEMRRLVNGLEQEIAEKQHAERANRKLLQAIEQAGNGVLIVDKLLHIEYANQRFLEMTGYHLPDLLQRQLNEVISLETALLQTMHEGSLSRATQSERKWQHVRDGSTAVLQTISPLFDSNREISHYLISGENINALKRTQAEVERLAFQDPLTNLDNRHLFRRHLQASLERVRRTQTRAALIYLDLDLFKEVNDTLGHDAGDELLKEVANRLSTAIRKDDSCARLGGDEFAIILNNVGNVNNCANIAAHLLEKLEAPFTLHGRQQPISASLGITMIPDDGDEAIQVMKNADLALYKAKEAGRHCYRFFTIELQHAVEHRHEMDLRLRNALSKEQFLLYWQPQIDLDTFRVTGFEALIRWQFNDAVLTPDKFLPIAEDNGLIQEIGRWVLRQAMTEQKHLSEAIGSDIRISVNLSPRQFSDQALLDDCRATLANADMSADLLEFEITENSLIQDIDQATEMLNSLRQLGVRVAIDDFGIGHCSLSYLRQLPVNTLKIDRSFVRDLPLDNSSNAIVAAVLAMSKKLSLQVVAEGIELNDQQDALTLGGCQYGQGYLYGRPMPVEHVAEWYAQFRQQFIRQESLRNAD